MSAFDEKLSAIEAETRRLRWMNRNRHITLILIRRFAFLQIYNLN